jgi:hypothetical protein
MEDVGCSLIQRMVVTRADYGDFNKTGTLDVNTNTDIYCSVLTNCQVKSLCDGSRSCGPTIDNNLLPRQYCPDVSKEIYIEYTCVDNFSSTTITTGKTSNHVIFKSRILLILVYY